MKFPSLFNVVRRKQDTVAAVLNSTPPNVSFRRVLRGQNLNNWNRIVSSIADVQLSEDPDFFYWSLHSSGQFSVKSMYAALVNNGVSVSQDIWRAKLPTKIKVFMWYLKNGVILTKDNLVRRNWHGDKSCAYCHVPETIQHLFFSCAHAKFLWRAVHVVFGISQPSSMDDLLNRRCKVGGTNIICCY